MGDWCRQDGHCKPKRNYGIGKEVDGPIESTQSEKTELSVERWEQQGWGVKRVYKVAAAPTSQLAAHSRSRIVLPRKTLFLAYGVVFPLDRCLLMGDPDDPEVIDQSFWPSMLDLIGNHWWYF